MIAREKVVVLLLMTLPLMIFWWFVKDIDQTYDWFLFVDFSQKPLWYVHYSAYHIENIIKMWIIWELASNYLGRKERKVAFAFLLLAGFRLIEYWLFRHNIPMIPIIAIVLFYSLYIYARK